MIVRCPHLLDRLHFSLNLLILLIVEELIEHLVEVHLGSILYIVIQTCEKVVQKVLVALANTALLLHQTCGFCQGKHVVVSHSVG